MNPNFRVTPIMFLLAVPGGRVQALAGGSHRLTIYRGIQRQAMLWGRPAEQNAS